MSPPRHRLSDKQALAALGAYLVFRAITQRLGLAFGPRLLDSAPWAIPLLNNSMLLLIQAGAGTVGRPLVFAAATVTSVLQSLVAGLVLYWAGHRFGDKLAELAARPGSPWAGVWNPKQIARAERWLEGWGLAVVFLGKVVEFFTVPIVLVAGATSMRMRRYLLAYVPGSIVFAVGGLYIGEVAAQKWKWLPRFIKHTYGPWALRIGLALLVLLVLLSLASRRMARSPEPEPESPAAAPATGEGDGAASTS